MYFNSLIRPLDFEKWRMNDCLCGVCNEIDSYSCFGLFKSLWRWQKGQITEDEFRRGDRLKLEIKNNDDFTIQGQFSIETGSTTITISQGLLNLIKNIKSKVDAFEYSYLENLADYFFDCFVHEDVYRQQPVIKVFKFFDKYVFYEFTTDPYELEIIRNLGHYNQATNVVTYGNKVGSLLTSEYREREGKEFEKGSIETVFDWIASKDIKDEQAVQLIKTYNDPRISRDARWNFFKVIYNYLNNNLEKEPIFHGEEKNYVQD